MTTQITLRGFGWTHAGRATPALDGIDLDIASGERVLLCGDSGSGKSTLLAALAGVLGGDEDGQQVGHLTLNPQTPAGLVLQDPDSQVIAATVGRDVAFGCENLGLPRAEIWRRVEHALDLVGLDVPLDHPTQRLSGGQKQRLALAGVIAMGAGLILLDEPTANLDPQGARDVVAAVERIVRATGATLVVVEHQYSAWSGLLDRAVRLDRGRIVEDGAYGAVTAARAVTGLPVAVPAPADAEAALWSNNLVTRFGPPRSVRVPQGYSTVITGANGSGKTTWLMTMAGLLPSCGGEIGVAESVRRGLRGEPSTWRSRDLAQRLGVVFQNPEHQFVARTVGEEMRVGPGVMGTSDAASQSRVGELLERLRLTHLVDANPFTLSGGEKRRLSVATALVAAPSVLLLDEPTFGQDPTTFAELVRMLRELANEGTTLVSVTHDPLFLAALGDHRVTVSAHTGQAGGSTHA